MRRNFPLAALTPRRLDHLFDDAFGGLLAPASGGTALQVRETDDAYLVRVELPGFSLEEVQVELTGDALSIQAKPGQQAEGWAPRPGHAYEVQLSGPVDAGKVQAELTNGVLLVTLPKSDAAKPRKIAVRPALQAAEPARLEQRQEPPAS
jgi:HSP20 family protein